MEAREFIDLLWPEHTRTSCSDDDLQNGFRTMGLIDGETGKVKADGRCLRCMLLEFERGYCYDGSLVPEDAVQHLKDSL
jgi:hypothetical protein